MFKVIGEIIEYNGQPFAYIIGSPITKGGWVIDARAEIEGAADLIDAAEITEFRTAFRSEINDILMERLTHAVENFGYRNRLRTCYAI